MIPYKEGYSLYKPKKEDCKVIPSKTTDRHRAGKRPDWAENSSEEENESEDEMKIDNPNPDDQIFTQKLPIRPNNITPTADILREIELRDKRLQRLDKDNQAKSAKEEKTIINERLQMRRTIYKSEVLYPEEPQLKNSRAELKKKLMNEHPKKEEDNEELLELIGNDDDEDDNDKEQLEKEENCEIKEDSIVDNENENEKPIEEDIEILMRPVFVLKEERKTITDTLQKELEEREIQEQRDKYMQIKKQETKKIVEKYIEQELNTEDPNNQDANQPNMPDDTDNLDDLEEYEKWKLRELHRIKRQVEEDEKKLKEILEIERRRKLTDQQRKDENLRLGSDDTLRPFKSKINYLQKYYHKGAFYQDASKEDMTHVYNRDYNLPTWEDKIDRSGLPSIMEKRRGKLFKKGQTKYTHLTKEDTTNFDPNFRIPDPITANLMNRCGGYKGKNQFDLSLSSRNKSNK